MGFITGWAYWPSAVAAGEAVIAVSIATAAGGTGAVASAAAGPSKVTSQLH